MDRVTTRYKKAAGWSPAARGASLNAIVLAHSDGGQNQCAQSGAQIGEYVALIHTSRLEPITKLTVSVV